MTVTSAPKKLELAFIILLVIARRQPAKTTPTQLLEHLTSMDGYKDDGDAIMETLNILHDKGHIHMTGAGSPIELREDIWLIPAKSPPKKEPAQ